MNVLFICSANKDRSKTAEDYFSKHNPDLDFDSAGTNRNICNQFGTNYICEEQLEWADKIYVMEQKHHKVLKETFSKSYSSKITVLNIKDSFKYGSKDLINLLKDKVNF